MADTYDDLKKKTVAELREMAAGLEHEAVKGYSQLNKEHLLEAVCQALGVEKHAHHEVVGLNKSSIKTRMKTNRSEALAALDGRKLKIIRREIHRLKRKIRRATV